MKNTLALLIICGFAGISTTYAAELENLVGVKTDTSGITFQATTGGCTTKASFELQKSNDSPVSLALVRVERDACRMYAPWGTPIKYTWTELGLSPGTKFRIENLITVLRPVDSTD